MVAYTVCLINLGPYRTCLELGCTDHTPNEQTASSHDKPATIAKIIDIINYSNLPKLLAVTAYVSRFINNARHTQPNSATLLSPAELSLASLKWIYTVQHEQFLAETRTYSHSYSDFYWYDRQDYF